METIRPRTIPNVLCKVAVGLAVLNAILQTGWWVLMAAGSSAGLHGASLDRAVTFIVSMALIMLIVHGALILLSRKWPILGGCIYVLLGFAYLLIVSPDWSGLVLVTTGLLFVVSMC